ncbi:macrophage mannose receptor 1-like [Silurus meridionalis]|uniref:macrophage mannose receptor 1-like n=1 Tax=Silurus meridionalis TaxID=175797 RepID=UPI001EECA879|nr:macrophage mannose receptor 1-like [Silurus meridionalis]
MASAVLFILLFLAGLFALALGASRQFYVVKENKKWDEAQKWCRENYTDLATIESEEEMNALKKALKTTSGHFWIGLKQDNSSSSVVFNNRSWVWSDNTRVSYKNWKDDEPNNNGINNAVEIWAESTGYIWNDAKNSYPQSFVCYKKRPPITVIAQNKKWQEALRFCRQNHVDLLYIYSKEMQNWVEYATQNVTTDVWIGLRHTCALGFWYWVSGETICYQNWAPGNGTGVEDCNGVERTGALLAASKKWVSLPQTQELNFICITF